MPKTLYTSVTFFIALLLFASSCVSRRQAESANEVDSLVANTSTTNQIQKIIHNLPPPTEVPFILQRMGANYLPNTVNTLDNIDEYQVSKNKLALNLGIYSTDIGYLSSYNLVDDAKLYLSACKDIAASIGVSTAYGQDLLDRFQNNLGNIDSLSAIINEGMRRTEEQLEELDEVSMASLSLTGSFIEGLYILTNIIESHNSDPELNAQQRQEIILPLINVIIEQRIPLLDNISVLKSIERSKDTNEILERLGHLRYSYEELQTYIINNDNNIKVNDPVVRTIIQEIRSIRNYITTV